MSTCKFLFIFNLFFPSKHTHIQRVIEVSKHYLPQTAVGFSSPKVKVHIQDGAEFMQQCAGQFDVIITDCSDPIGEDSSIEGMVYSNVFTKGVLKNSFIYSRRL